MNIRVDLNYPIKDGTEVIFRSPVDCSQVTGLKVYYPDGSQEFVLADAHGNNVGDIDHLFAENVAVKVILDVTTNMAFVQNADTNAYLEEQLANRVTHEELKEALDNLDINPGGGGGGDTNPEEITEIVATDLQDRGVTYDALASVMNREVMDGKGDIAGALWMSAMGVHEDAFYSDMEMYGFLSYSEEEGHIPNVYTKKEVDAQLGGIETAIDSIEAGKAVIVTVSGSTPSHTSQEIYDLIQDGKVVYLHLWGNTFTVCTGCTASEAKFENSYVTSVTGDDGKTYSAQAFRLLLIRNGSYAATSETVPTKAYIDAQIAYYLNQ